MCLLQKICTFVPLRLIDVRCLQECINLKLINGGNVCNFIIRFRSQSQTHDEFETFIKKFELILDKFNKKDLL